MAENAANFTLTFQNKPSVFEVIAQKSLNESIHPALRRFALFLFTSNPSKFKWLDEYFEETFLILNGILQYHYLKYYDSSFSENFYGLKRILTDNKNLSVADKKAAFIFLVLLPYLKRKIEEKIEIYKIERAEGSLKNDFGGVFKKFLIIFHSAFEVSVGVFTLVNYLKYMASKTDPQLPVLHVLQQKLAYAEENPNVSNFWTAFFKGDLNIRELSFGLFKNAVTSTLEVSAFFLQFLQVWNAEKSNVDITALPIVPPPSVDSKAKNYKGKCPICLKSWQNPTVLQISGYIFCFRCILRYLNENKKCPITNLPAKPLNIVRLYID